MQTDHIAYTTILRPILLYGSESWALTNKTKSKIQAAEMKILRVIKGVTRRDRLRNVDIRNELGITSILDIVERNKLRWYGHVQRMEEDRLPKIMLEWTPQGRRPVGRPRRRWMEGIREALVRREEDPNELERDDVYLRRNEWRRIVNRGTVD